MTSRRFPRSPVITPRPFDKGTNPFADDVQSPISPSDNPLSPPASDEVQPFKATDYEQTQTDRSLRVLLFGVSGAAFIGASLLIAIVVVASTSVWGAELVFCFPANLLGLSLCIPAWVMAKADLRAMEAGVMDNSGGRRTRIGYWCGSIGTFCGVFPFLGVIIAIILSIIG